MTFHAYNHACSEREKQLLEEEEVHKETVSQLR